MFTIISIPLIALRSESSEKAEMVSQLLFGEQIEILEEKEGWFFVRNLTDDYKGWVSTSCLHKKDFRQTQQKTSNISVLKSSCAICTKISNNEKMLLSGGSLIPKLTQNKFELFGETYQLEDIKQKTQNIIELALQYLNTPYLWGGKSAMGIDCSGFVQIIFSMLGKQLPRDASQQVEKGKIVTSLSQSKSGDVAFFENEDHKIVHVGILINPNQIIHASGYVKIETIDERGIISKTTLKYTHQLKTIKRLINN